MRGRRATIHLVVAIGALGFAALAWPAKTPARCAAGKVAVAISGKRACLPARRVRPTTPPVSRTADLVRQALARPGVIPLRPGRRSPTPFSPALIRRATSRAAALEAQIRTAIAAGRPTELGSPARALADAAPQVTVAQNPDGSISGRASATVEGSGGSLTMDVSATSRDGAMEFDVGLSVTATDGSRARVTIGASDEGTTSAICPTETGDIVLNGGSGARRAASQTFASGGVTLGTARVAGSVRTSRRAHARLDGQATLQPIPFTVTGSADLATSFQGLAFFQRNLRLTESGSFTGTINPTTGQVAGGSLTIRRRFTSGGGDLQPSGDPVLQSILREEAGRIFADAKAAEQRARSGRCTSMSLSPDTGAELDPGATTQVRARLNAASNATVDTVSWTASAGKGSIAPGGSRDAQPSFTVTADSRGPETASVTFRAVSPAGISERTWTAREGDPPRLRIEAQGVFTGFDSIGNATVTGNLTFEAVRTEPSVYTLMTPVPWTGLQQSITFTPSGGCLFTPTQANVVFPQPNTTAAVRSNGGVTVFLRIALSAGYRETCPATGFTRDAAIGVGGPLNVNVVVHPGTPAQVTGTGPSGTNNITVNVTELRSPG